MLFTKDEDFLAFEGVVEESLRTRRMRLCDYCLKSNHWHFVVWPERDGDLPAFMQQMTNMHVKRWKEHRHEIGYTLATWKTKEAGVGLAEDGSISPCHSYAPNLVAVTLSFFRGLCFIDRQEGNALTTPRECMWATRFSAGRAIGRLQPRASLHRLDELLGRRSLDLKNVVDPRVVFPFCTRTSMSGPLAVL